MVTRRLFLILALGVVSGVSASLYTPCVLAENSRVVLPPKPDPHYTDVGFFDIRICNWPDQPVFMQALFSTKNRDLIRKVEVIDPSGNQLGEVGLEKFRLLKQKDGTTKRVFMTPFPLSADAKDGWYTGRITTVDGIVYLARDRVKIDRLQMASNPRPAANAENISIPTELSWDAVPGAKAYQVFVHDIWDGENLIYRSPHLSSNRAIMPAGLLKAGGYYMWRIHARNIDEDVEWGDFNHGSLTPFFKFSVR